MQINTHFKVISPTQEIIEEIKRAAKGGEELFEKAGLRPQDEVWWTEVTNEIVEDLQRTITLQSVPDEDIFACIPESAFKGCYSERDKELVREKCLRNARKGGRWVVTLGFFLRDCERLHMEALGLGSKVIQARGQLRAFAMVIAMALGCASVKTEDRDD